MKTKKTTRKTKPTSGPARVVRSRPAPRPRRDLWALRLYVAGQTPRSITAFANLKRLCEEHLPGRHTIEVIDLSKYPERAHGDGIVALPTLVRKLPTPIKRVIGDLSNFERVLVAIELKAAQLAHDLS